MKFWHFLIFLFAFLLYGCNETPIVDENLWVGTYKGFDKNAPYPYLLQKKSDSIYLINHKNEVIDSGSVFSKLKKRDTIKMENSGFLILKNSPNLAVYNFKDTISYPALAFFEHPEKTENMALTDLRNNLKNKTFSSRVKSPHFATPNRDLSVEKLLSFSKDSLQRINRYYYQDELVHEEQQVKKIGFFERNGKIFFSENENPENPQMIYQILNYGTDSFKIRYYADEERIEENFSAEKEAIKTDPVYFSRCLEGQPGEYYHSDITFRKGNEFIINKIAENAPKAKGNGYITVHFTLNCEGKMGHLGLEQMNMEYKSTSFNTDFVKHIITEVMKLKDWPEIEPGYFYKDVHAFLMFKIENGKITDLCP